MILDLTLDISNLDAALSVFDELDVSAPGPLQDGMSEAMLVYFDSMRERFFSASLGDGTWAPLSERRLRERARYGTGTDILVETGTLQNSLIRGGDDHVLEFTEDSVIEGSSEFTAHLHQGGTAWMPARPILVEPSEVTVQEMVAPLAAGIQEQIAASINGV